MARRMQSPINSVKHYVQHSNAVVASGAIINQIVAVGVQAPATSTTADVRQGAVIKAVFVERWIVGDGTTGVSCQFTLTIEKKRKGEPNMTAANAANLMAYPNKKNILYTTQGIIPSAIDGANSVPVVRQFFLIPKGKQRFGQDDQLIVNIAAIVALRNCGFETYKEYV